MFLIGFGCFRYFRQSFCIFCCENIFEFFLVLVKSTWGCLDLMDSSLMATFGQADKRGAGKENKNIGMQ